MNRGAQGFAGPVLSTCGAADPKHESRQPLAEARRNTADTATLPFSRLRGHLQEATQGLENLVVCRGRGREALKPSFQHRLPELHALRGPSLRLRLRPLRLRPFRPFAQSQDRQGQGPRGEAREGVARSRDALKCSEDDGITEDLFEEFLF